MKNVQLQPSRQKNEQFVNNFTVTLAFDLEKKKLQ